MSDPLTLAASAIGITSLAIQLLEKTKTIHELWTLVRDAPAELTRLLEDLEDVSQLLQEVIEQATNVDPSSRAILFVRKCEIRLDELRDTVGSMDTSSGNGRRAFVKRAVKILGNDQKVLRMRNNLQETIHYLSLALQILQSQQTTQLKQYGHHAFEELRTHAEQSQQSSSIVSEMSVKFYTEIVQLRQELNSVSQLNGHRAAGSSEKVPPGSDLVIRQNGRKLRDNSQVKWSQRRTTWRIPLIFGSVTVSHRIQELEDEEGTNVRNKTPLAKEYGIIFQPSRMLYSGFKAAMAWENTGSAYQLHQTLQPIFYLPMDHPLFVGAIEGDEQVVQHYITKFGTANVFSTSDYYSCSLLQFAVKYRQRKIVRTLIANNADVNYVDDDKRSVIMFSVVGWSSDIDLEMSRSILYDKRVDPYLIEPYHWSCWHSLTMTSYLWQLLAGVAVPMLEHRDVLGQTPLHVYCQAHDIAADVCYLALKSGADVNSLLPELLDNIHPLRLLSSELSEGWVGASPLHLAIISVQSAAKDQTQVRSAEASSVEFVNCYSELANVIYSRGTLFGDVRVKVLTEDARQDQKRKIKILIENGADLHSVSKFWGSPTDIAKLSNNMEIWYDVLEDCNIELEPFLAKDTAIERTQDFENCQSGVRERRTTRNVLQRQWCSIVRDTESAGGLDPAKSHFDSIVLDHTSRNMCHLCFEPGTTESTCSHLYYLRVFILLFLSVGLRSPEVDEQTELLAIGAVDDLQTWVDDLQPWLETESREFDLDDLYMLLLEQTGRVRRDSGLGFRRFLHRIYQQNPVQSELQQLGIGSDFNKSRSNTEANSDTGQESRSDPELSDDGSCSSEVTGAGKEQHHQRTKTYYTERHARDEGPIERQKCHMEGRHDDGEYADAGYWFLCQVMVEVFFITQWPRTVDVDFEELSTKLRMKAMEVEVPGAWPGNGD